MSGAQGRLKRKNKPEEAKISCKLLAAFLREGNVEDNGRPSCSNYPKEATLNNKEEKTIEKTSPVKSDKSQKVTSSTAEPSVLKFADDRCDAKETQSCDSQEDVELTVETPTLTGELDAPNVTQLDELPIIEEVPVLQPEIDEAKKPLPDVIQRKDFGHLMFDKFSRKAVLSDALCTEMLLKGSRFFLNSTGPFSMKNERSMTSSWFKRRLGKG